VECPDLTADERAGVAEQIALDTVDVRRVRHDQDRVAIERVQIAVEQALDLARIRGPGEQGQTHRVHPSQGAGRLRLRERRRVWKERGKMEGRSGSAPPRLTLRTSDAARDGRPRCRAS